MANDPLAMKVITGIDFSAAPPTSFLSAICDAAPEPLIGTLISFPPSISAGAATRCGYQWAFIDMEHSPYSAREATQICHSVIAASLGHCLPIIRVPSHGVEWIKWALDSGAAGVVIPMVNTRAEMEAIVNRALYPPVGARSFGAFQAPYASLDPSMNVADYCNMARQPNQIAILPIIESKEGIGNAEDILSVPGVTGALVGPYDMRLSMGLPGAMDGPEQEFVDSMDKVVALGKKLNKVIGTLAVGEAVARKRKQQGYDFLMCGTDLNALLRGLTADLEDVRRGLRS